MIGRTLAHYEITAKLGQGGMGSVWRARDTKLGREVAIKTLPDEFAEDADRVARFQREAKLLASLNHPNIAAIHGLEEADGKHFLVLELVEGDTIADRIQSGPVEIEEALRLGLQITEALEAAHDKGVVHRDLKPANIKITPDGKVKVLDFGLAKALTGETEDTNLSQSPTLSMAATQQGVILGTASYMSPEQAKGRATDKRTDIWAFGCVLFEMITGRQSFGASDVSEALAAVIRAEPEWNSLPANLHPRLREVLERCLEKDVKQRYHDVADVRVDIEKVLADPDGVIVQPVSEVVQTAAQSKLPWVAAIVLAILFSAGGVWLLTPEPSVQVSRWNHVLPEGRDFRGVSRTIVAISPDGRQFVYNGAGGLYLRSVDELEDRLILGTEDGLANVTFSPDGEWVAFWSLTGSQLKKIAVVGGASVTITDTGGNPQGISWDVEGSILFGGGPAGILGVSADGGEPEVVVPPLEEGSPINPQLLANGSAVLFEIPGGRIGVHSLDSGESKPLFPGSRARYVTTGHIVYFLDGALYAVPFDLGSLEVTGGPVPMVEGAQNQFALSDSGSLVYVPGESGAARRTLVWVDRSGVSETVETIPPGEFQAPRLSPDEERILLVDAGNAWIYDIATGRRSPVTTDGSVSNEAEWDPTGTQVAFSSGRAGPLNVFIQPADGSGQARQFSNSLEGRIEVDSWSPDGDVILAHHHSPEGPTNILAIPVGEEASEPQDFLVREFGEMGSMFSPDGRYVAYVSNESGQNEVYIRPYPGPGSQTTVSVGGGTEPIWRGDELFYRRPRDYHMMAVSVTTEQELEVGEITELFESSDYYGVSTPPRPDYHVTADGSRFLMVTDEANQFGQAQINVILNWFQELRERVPVD